MKRYRQVAGFILAGGASSRMGVDKGLLDFGGKPLILRTAEILDSLISQITLVGCPERYAALGLPTIADDPDSTSALNPKDRFGRGPLAGIAAALSATTSHWNLIVACDMPYLSSGWIDWLLSRAVNSDAQVVVPQTDRGLEPLAAVYRVECHEVIKQALADGERKVIGVISKLQLDVVDHLDWRERDATGLALKNMNTPEHYKQALEWWSSKSGDTKPPRR